MKDLGPLGDHFLFQYVSMGLGFRVFFFFLARTRTKNGGVYETMGT